jgi:adenylate kinase family enzyme
MILKKIIIIGSGGAGKSTLAREIGKITGIKVIHLDKLFWKPGWISLDKEEWEKTVENIVKGDSWIIDGNYMGTMEIRLSEADTVIYLDFPRVVCLCRAFERFVKYKRKTRPDIAEGCKEKMDIEFVKWIWTFPDKVRPEILRKLEESKKNKNIIILKSNQEVRNYLERLAEDFNLEQTAYSSNK